MGTQVLYPQDLLSQHTPSFHRRRNFPVHRDPTNLRPSNDSGYKKASPRPDKRKSTETRRITQGADTRRKDGAQVKILRRGQSYDSLASRGDAKSKCPPMKSAADDMAVLPKQIRLAPAPLADIYAGSAFVLSPSPRNLPLPSFCSNKKQQDTDEPATRDLRRLLRLE